MADIARQALCDVVASQGPSICEDPQRCETLLMQECPRFRPQVQLLMHALKLHIVDEIHSISGDDDWNEKSQPLVDSLVNAGMTEDNARWTLESWAEALGKKRKTAALNLEAMLTAKKPEPPPPGEEAPLVDPEEELAFERQRAFQMGLKHLGIVSLGSAIGGVIGGVVLGMIIGAYIGAAVAEETKQGDSAVLLGGVLGAVFGAILPAMGGAIGGAGAFALSGGLQPAEVADQAYVKALTTTLCAAVGAAGGAIVGGMLLIHIGMFFGSLAGAAVAVGLGSILGKMWD